jgi:Leucine-rich repeat (LRR) protein
MLTTDGNRLKSLSSTRALMSLRNLRISDNELASLDLASFPKIRTLYADGNRLSGLARSDGSRSRLENLSLRYQEGADIRIDWEELAGVRRLYLSGRSRFATVGANS